jgi:hypothetical protein
MVQSNNHSTKAYTIMTILSYLYLFLGYIVIIGNFAYHIRGIRVAVLSAAFLLFITLISIIIYSVINHVFIKHFIAHKVLVLFEIFLLLSLSSIGQCDLYIERWRMVGLWINDLKIAVIDFMINLLSA